MLPTLPEIIKMLGLPVPGILGVRGPANPASPRVPAKTPGPHGVNDAAAKAAGAKVAKPPAAAKDPNAFPRKSALDAIKQHEGFEDYLYLDSVGIITIGYGWNLEASLAKNQRDTAPAEALALPFILQTTNQPPPDRPKAIQADWDALRKISKDGTYKFTKKNGKTGIHSADWYKDKVALYIDTSTPNNALQQRFDSDVARFTADLKKMFPDFDTFPVAAREGLLDMAFNMGTGRSAVAAQAADAVHHTKARKGHGASGLHKFSHLLTDITNRDWNAAAKDSNRPQVNGDRNSWTFRMFTEAAGAAAAKPN